MNERILIIGVRRRCYKAAKKLGNTVFLWSDGPLNEFRKNSLDGWLEVPYADCKNGITQEVKDYVSAYKITRVIANTEESVVLGAHVRQYLDIKPVGLKLAERFHNKFVMKNSAAQADVPITKYKLIEQTTTAEELISDLALPLVLKPVDESGAQDIKIARSEDDVSKFMQPGLLAETFVDGTEVSVETFVQNGEPIFHNITDYLHQWRKSLVPAELEDDLKLRVLELNDRVIRHFKLNRGMTHAEFYLTKDGPVFGEIAVRPPGGYYMELIQKTYGFDTWKTFIQVSCGVEVEKPNPTPKGCTAVVMLHPGPGEIISIEGEQAVREQLTNIVEFKIRKKTGDAVLEHTNTSNEVGHIIFWEESREQVLENIAFIEKTLQFKVRAFTS